MAVFIRWISVAVLALIAVYVGVAGWVACKAFENTSVSAGPDHYREYDGLTFENAQSLEAFLHDSESAQSFPWIFSTPQELVPMITSIAFGLLGGVIGLLKKIVVDGLPISRVPVITAPLFSSLVGMMLFFLSFLAPAIFVMGRTPPRTETLVGVSLFGGAFSERAYIWIDAQIKKLFPSKSRSRGQSVGAKG